MDVDVSKTALRHASCHDLTALTRIFASSFWDEEVIGDLMHPHRNQFPDDYRAFWRRRLMVQLWDPALVMLVSYDHATREVTGAAVWKKKQEKKRENECDKWWGSWRAWDLRSLTGNLIKGLVTGANLISTSLYPNRAANLNELDIESRTFPFISHFWSRNRRVCWSLECLAVDLEHRKAGIGRNLVHWGIQRAMTDCTAISVISAHERELFYQRCGLVHEAGRATDGEGNPLAGRIKGGLVLFRDTEDASE